MEVMSGCIVEPPDRTKNDESECPEKHRPLIRVMFWARRIGHRASKYRKYDRVKPLALRPFVLFWTNRGFTFAGWLLRLPGLFQQFSHFLIGGLRKVF